MDRIKEFFNKYQGPILLLLALLTIYLISVFPPSGDDFNRLHEGFVGIEGGIARVKRLYQTLNGRVLGNEISYVFINRPARTIIKFTSFLLYIVMMMKVLNIKRVSALMIILGSVILMPLPLTRQVWVWSSGFYNYIPPIILMLVQIYTFIYHRKDFTPGQLAFIFIIALASCLFMENLTVYFLFLPLIMALCFWNKDNKAGYLASFAGAGLGALIMFSSPVYRKVASGEDGYRDLATTGLDFIADNWEIFSEYMLTYNVFIVILLAISLALMTYRAYREDRFPLAGLALVNLGAIVVTTFILPQGRAQLISLMLHVSFYILLIAIALTSPKAKAFNSRLIVFSCLSMALAMGPLLVVSPVSQRNFFTPIVFNVFIIISLMRMAGLPARLEKVLNRLIPIAMALVFGVYLVVYSVNYSYFLKRDRILREAAEAGQEEAYIPPYPFEDFNGGYGTDSMGNYYYREEQKDMKIHIVE